ncbi:MAG: hypothetical protein ACRC6R_09380 [Bacteroidales bacterium]
MKIKSIITSLIALLLLGVSANAQYIERASDDYRTNWNDLYDTETPMISTYGDPGVDADPVPIEDGYIAIIILGVAYALWKKRGRVQKA